MVVSAWTRSGCLAEVGVGSDDQVDAPLVRLRGLAEQQSDDLRGPDVRAQRVVEVGRRAADLVQVLQRLVGPAELEQPGERVHPVRELVLLGADRFREAALAVELAGQAVNSVRSCSVTTAPCARPPMVTGMRLMTRHVVVGDRDRVRDRGRSGEGVAEGARRQDLVEDRPPAPSGEAEQPPGLIVDDGDPPGGVDGDDALADAVQRRLPLLQEARDLIQLEPERAPLQQTRQRERGERSDGEHEHEPRRVGREFGQQFAADAALPDADGDFADHGVPSPKSGTRALAFTPVAPESMPRCTRPSRATSGSDTFCPMRDGSGCECRTRSRSMTTT